MRRGHVQDENSDLFDSVEELELSEPDRRFFKAFRVVLLVLEAIVIVIAKMDVTVHLYRSPCSPQVSIFFMLQLQYGKGSLCIRQA